MSIRACSACVAAGVLLHLALCARVLAQSTSGADEAQSPEERSAQSARAGMFLPYTMAPRVDSQRAFALALGGYDQARRSSQLEGTAEVTLIGPLAARVGVLYGQSRRALRPSAGLRVQALSQASAGIDMSVGGFYRPEGFTEAEGEVEAVLAFGRQLGHLSLFANLIYGQDPEGAERDGEVRLAGLYAFSARLLAGLDMRLRGDLGSKPGVRRAKGEAEYDFIAGPLVSYTLGAVALIAQAGVSTVGQSSLQSGLRVGPACLAGLAGAL
jgi:hypothetical protein